MSEVKKLIWMNDFKTESKRLMKNSGIYLNCSLDAYLETFEEAYQERIKEGQILHEVLGDAQDVALHCFIHWIDKIRDEAMSQYMFYTELKPLIENKK